MAHVEGQSRCQRCKEFWPTMAVRVGRMVRQLCVGCQLDVGYRDAEEPRAREAGPRGRLTRPLNLPAKKVVAPPKGATLPGIRVEGEE